jgi:penicillin G amidase
MTPARTDDAYLRSKLPPRDATLHGPVSAPVTLRWDTWGIPHIRAKTRRDLGYGLGYATAQEHLWRLEFCRRQARGTLAAVLGRGALGSDRTLRLAGLGQHADESWQREPEDVVETMQGLADGINAWREHAIRGHALPVEFDWLEFEPDVWTVADSVAVWKGRWWGLTSRLDNIALGEAARRYLPSSLQAAFMTVELGHETIVPPEDTPWISARSFSGGPSSTVPGGADTGEGSNNWAVAGSRTSTGFPVLCSDPHNPFTQPSQWFEAQLTLEDGSLDVAGAAYAGAPAIYFGRNRHVAWGFTNHVAPQRDLFVEEVQEENPTRYREGGEWRPFEVTHATIQVRGEPDETFEIRRTVRGPVVNALLPRLGTGDKPPDGPITLRWLGTEVGTGLESLLGMNAARTAAEAVQSMSRWVSPVGNLLVADDQGHITYHAIGRVPHRAEAARRYRRANAPEDEWQGFIPYEALPQLDNPARGWLASANQPPWRQDPPGIPYLAGAAWADGGRMKRIAAQFAEPRKRTPLELGAIQADIVSERAVALLPALLTLLDQSRTQIQTGASASGADAADAAGGTGNTNDVGGAGEAAGSLSVPASHALDILRGWGCEFSLDSPAPSVWTAFWDQWLRRVAAARFPAHTVGLVASQAGAVARDLLLGQDTSPSWFGGLPIGGEVAAAFEAAVTWLGERVGTDPTSWTWGRLHSVTWPHAIAESGPDALRAEARGLLDVGSFPTTGGNTVRAAGFASAHPYRVVSGASYRLVSDLSPAAGFWTINTTGQSGHPASPHYADQSPLWLADHYHPFPMDENFEAEGVTRITPG